MKKVIILVISLLTAASSFLWAKKRDNTMKPDEGLLLNTSSSVYSHGSHASHCSHASHLSHYSMYTTSQDSITGFSAQDRSMVETKLSEELNKAVVVKNLYVSDSWEINPHGHATLVASSKEYGTCIYIKYSFKDDNRDPYELFIPIKRTFTQTICHSSVYYRVSSYIGAQELTMTSWMEKLIQKVK